MGVHAQTSRADSLATVYREAQRQRDSATDAREKLMDETRRRQEAYRDSMTDAREKAADLMRAKNDSMKEARLRISDSMQFIRKLRSDSLAYIRKYKESKFYKDSVASFRKQRTDSIQSVRKAFFDSVKTARKRITDSTTLVRKTLMDSVHAVQKNRSDSLASIRKYRAGKRFADSVVVVKKLRADSLKVVRKGRSDSVLSARKKITDSFARVRKGRTDSLAKARKVRTDSLAVVKKVKTDSLAKMKEKRVKNQKAKELDKEKKQQLAFELKIKKKHQAYSNEKMLKKGWGLPRQVVQNTFTRYNYYYNAERKLAEADQNMRRVRKDNYDELIALFPFDPDKDSASIAPDMDSIIRKVSVGIQIHDPRTKWGDDLYLILGQAYFYKGNYPDAASSFRYILSLKDKKKVSKKGAPRSKAPTKTLSIAQPDKKGALAFLKHQSVNNEAILWLARTFTQMRQEGNAESVLDLLEADPNFPPSLKGRLALEKSFIALHQNDYKLAADQLAIVAKDDNTPNYIRMRAAFIDGQLLMRRNDYKGAGAAFAQVIDLYPKIEMDFHARKNMAYSAMLSGGDQKDAIASLKKVLNDGKYAPYYEQVYYILGRLAANNGDDPAAISYLQQGISSSKSTRKQKAVSFAALGNIYYKLKDYNNAKSSYDSAVAMAQSAPNDSLILVAVKRSTALNSIMGPYNTIHAQDSLLALAAMSSKDQRSEARRYIKHLEQLKVDSAFKAENAVLNNASNSSQSSTSNPNGGGSTYSNWYFSSASLMQQGMNEFKRKWGTRTLTDNWRRSVGSGFDNNDLARNSGNSNSNNSSSPDIDENGLPTEESLMAFIPATDEAKDESRGLIRRAYMDMANAYVNDLEDYPPATHTLDTFDRKYPAHEYKAEALYIRYIVATRQSRIKDAQGYAARILQEYQDTKWADLVRPSESGSNADTMMVAGEAVYYDETYDLLMQHQYKPVLARTREAKTRFGDLAYRKRFTIVEGAALAGNGDYKMADTLLNNFIITYPTDTLRPWAEAILKYVKENKPAEVIPVPSADTSGGRATGAVSGQAPPVPAGGIAQTLPPGSEAGSAPPPPPAAGSAPVMGAVPSGGTGGVPPTYMYKAMEEHFVLFTFGILESRSMGVKAGISDFNIFKYGDKKLVTEIQSLTTEKGIVVVKSFKNAQQAQSYLAVLRNEPKVSREYKTGEYQWLLISTTNYDKLMADRNLDTYIKFYNAKYK